MKSNFLSNIGEVTSQKLLPKLLSTKLLFICYMKSNLLSNIGQVTSQKLLPAQIQIVAHVKVLLKLLIEGYFAFVTNKVTLQVTAERLLLQCYTNLLPKCVICYIEQSDFTRQGVTVTMVLGPYLLRCLARIGRLTSHQDPYLHRCMVRIHRLCVGSHAADNTQTRRRSTPSFHTRLACTPIHVLCG